MRMEGTVKLLGDGYVVRSFNKRAVIEIGDQTVYNVLVPQRLSSYVHVGEDVAFGYAQLLWTKQALAVSTSDGRVHKVGALRMGFVALCTFVMTILCVLGALAATPAFWIVAIAFGVWFVQSFNGFRIATSFAPLARPSDPVGA